MAEDAAGGARGAAVTDSAGGDGPATTDPESIRRIVREYGAWAPVYDWFARATASVGGVRAGCVAALDLDPGDTVVDFGCGPGVNFPALREAVGPDGRVVGVDVTGPMLDRARALVERRGWTNVSVVRGDATRPPISRADGALATFVTSLFPDPYAVVARWCDLADSVVVANFAPHGGRVANAALGAFARLNARLFDFEVGDPLGQLEARTEASRRALVDCTDEVAVEDYVFGTIRVQAGRS
ncbi:class I SAM-dependent methyltransferase [Halobellus rufus]|uniref:class I SAM-dependent methyltransferase n=1 Tax=Halobellus rufus TaxID=1448860 RepID=UPI000678B34B|nr:class I SAM-dependent methyltransferase [Halobellus rufus]